MNKLLLLILGAMLIMPIVYGMITHSGDIHYTTTENYYNVTNNDSVFVNTTGDTMTGNLNMSGNSLTDVGEIIMQGLVTSQDVIPITDGIYSIGNSTLWFYEAYIENMYALNINASEINSSEINSNNVDVESNLSLGGHKLINDGTDLIMKLGG